MITPDTPDNESERLEALYKYKILDTSPEKEFDELVELASKICDTPISLVTLLDEDRQWFKAKLGLGPSETSRDISFCGHAIHGDEVFVIRDAKEDERFADNPLVQDDPNIRFYAGMPLITPEGHRLGTLCVIDNKPRDISEDQLFALQVISRQVTKQMDLMLANREIADSARRVHKQNQQLEKLNNINSKILSIISHDLRSPFNSMSGFIDLLESGALSGEELKKSFYELKNLLNSSSELLENLIQWGVLQVNSAQIQVQEISLYNLVEEIIRGLELTAHEKNNQLKNHIKRSSTIRAESIMLRFIIRNLVQNANKFTKSGLIEIDAEENEDFHIITVKDNGRGIAKDQQDRLFKWQNRESSLGTSGEKGSGLGLLLSKEFVENHRGEIKVSSEVEEGTEFRFTISKGL